MTSTHMPRESRPAFPERGSRIRATVGLATAFAGMALFGCVGAREGPFVGDPSAIARGRALAEQVCGACHGLGLTGASSYVGAPPFRALHYDYDAISYQRSMGTWHGGQAGMPPSDLTGQQIGDIGAYIHSLRQAAPH